MASNIAATSDNGNSSNGADESYDADKGTINFGAEYEYLVLTFITLKLILNQNVKKFWLWTNQENCKYGKFDDIVVKIDFFEESKCSWAVQVKHCTTNKNKFLKIYKKEKKINLVPKYFGDIIQLPISENEHYILFTNSKFNLPSGTISCNDLFLSAEAIPKNNCLCELNTCDNEEFVYKCKSETNTDTKNFFDHFYLFSQQKNYSQLKSYIIELLGKSVCDENCFELYFQFLKRWSQKTRRAILTQKDLTITLVAYMLSKFIPKFTPRQKGKNDDLLKEAFLNFDVTIIESKENSVIDKLWSIVDSEESNKLDFEKLVERCWYQKHPLIIISIPDPTALKIFEAAVSLCKQNGLKHKFILLTTYPIQQNNWSIFKILKDLKKDIFEKIQEKMEFSIQGKHFFKIQQLLSTEQCEGLTVKDLLDLINTATVGIKTVREEDYIEREISRNFISFEIFEKTLKFFLIIIQGKSSYEDICKRIPNYNIVRINDFEDNAVKNIVYVEEDKGIEKFICKNKTKSFLWLKYSKEEKDSLEIISSYGYIELLKKYKRPEIYFVKEKCFFSPLLSKLNIFCADPGMGRSTFLRNMQPLFPHDYWVVNIPLRAHSLFFETKRSLDEIIEKFVVYNQTNLIFDKKIFEIVKSKEKIVFLWDGIHEVVGDNFDNVLSLIVELYDKEFIQCCSSRNYLKWDLEKKFGIFTRTINSFDQSSQKLFIQHHLSKTGKLTEQQESQFQRFLEKVPEHFCQLPLQLFMITDLFSNSKLNTNIPKIISKTDFYDYFVSQKIDMYYNSFTTNTDLLRNNKEYLIEKFENVALKLFFYEEIYIKINNKNYNETFLENVHAGWNLSGIIKDVEIGPKGRVPNFTHMSYAEYFAASFLAKNYGMLPDLKDFFFEKKNLNIRYMFDLILSKTHPLHLNILQKNFKNFEENITDDKDQGGRTPLHILCSWSENHKIRSSRYDEDTRDGDGVNDDSYSKNYRKLLHKLLKIYNPEDKDIVFDMNAFEYAELSGSKLARQVLSEYYKNRRHYCSLI